MSKRHHLGPKGTACGIKGPASVLDLYITTATDRDTQDRLVDCPRCRAMLGLDAPEPTPTKPTHESVAAAWAAYCGEDDDTTVTVENYAEIWRVYLHSGATIWPGARGHTAPTYDEALAKAAAEIARVVERDGSDDSDSDGGEE